MASKVSRNASLIRTLIAKPIRLCGPSSRLSFDSQRNNSFSWQAESPR